MPPATAPAHSAIGLNLTGVSRRFDGGVVALDGINLQIPAGQFIALLGPSGCGKSTLLRLIAGLDQPTSGTIGTEQARDAVGRSDIAYVFQDAHLLPWRNVLDNVALPLELMGVPRAHRRGAARAAIEQVQLADAATRYPAQLSGGMRMRVSLARALVTRPRLLLLDEPFAALDEITRQRLDEQLRDIWLAGGVTVVFVTHSISEATFLAERAVVLSHRPARILLDHSFALPRHRPGGIRTEERFAREMHVLYEALQRSEGASR